MLDKNLQVRIDAFREFVRGRRWSVAAEKEIDYGYQLVVTDGISKTPVDFFKSGKTLIQGKPSTLQTEIRSWADEERRATSTTLPMFPEFIASQPEIGIHPTSDTTATVTKTTGLARIGSDESGKGDYFGPLVIGAVYVDGQTEAQLATLGVRDSKLLPDYRILAMAEVIKTTCPHFVVSIGPKTYNEMYEEFQNLNHLLAWGHARSLEKVLERVSCDLAIADQFGNESYLLNALLKKGRQVKLEQRPRAESDIAVAAASILARADFVKRMEQLSKRVGKTLPKGASDPAIIIVGREIVGQGSQRALAEVAKLHFKTTSTILQG